MFFAGARQRGRLLCFFANVHLRGGTWPAPPPVQFPAPDAAQILCAMGMAQAGTFLWQGSHRLHRPGANPTAVRRKIPAAGRTAPDAAAVRPSPDENRCLCLQKVYIKLFQRKKRGAGFPAPLAVSFRCSWFVAWRRRNRRPQMTPCTIITSATFLKPAMLAPRARLPGSPHSTDAS